MCRRPRVVRYTAESSSYKILSLAFCCAFEAPLFQSQGFGQLEKSFPGRMTYIDLVMMVLCRHRDQIDRTREFKENVPGRGFVSVGFEIVRFSSLAQREFRVS